MYFEDYQPGDTSRFGAYQVTESEIIEFASKYDPQYFHLDDEAAKDSLFGPFVQTVGGEVCSGTSFSFQGNAFNLGAQGEWFWEVDNVWSGAAQDYGTITSDFEGFSYTFENPDLLTDTVTIDLEVSRLNGCYAATSATLLVRPEFQPEINDAAGCTPFAFTVPNQNALSVDWDFGDSGNPGPEGASAHLYTIAGNYIVTGQGTSVFGCDGSATAAIEVFGSPTPTLSAENTLCAPEPVNPQRSGTPEDGATSWTLQVDLARSLQLNRVFSLVQNKVGSVTSFVCGNGSEARSFRDVSMRRTASEDTSTRIFYNRFIFTSHLNIHNI